MPGVWRVGCGAGACALPAVSALALGCCACMLGDALLPVLQLLRGMSLGGIRMICMLGGDAALYMGTAEPLLIVGLNLLLIFSLYI